MKQDANSVPRELCVPVAFARRCTALLAEDSIEIQVLEPSESEAQECSSKYDD